MREEYKKAGVTALGDQAYVHFPSLSQNRNNGAAESRSSGAR